MCDCYVYDELGFHCQIAKCRNHKQLLLLHRASNNIYNIPQH